MLFEYLQDNYMTILLILTLVIVNFVYKDYDIPATSMIPIAVVLVLLGSVSYFLSEWASQYTTVHQGEDLSNYLLLRRIASVVNYVLQPLSMMLQTFIILPKTKYRFYIAIPAILNAILYIIAPFTDNLVFTITEEGYFRRGPLGLAVFYVSAFYAILVLSASLYYFRGRNRRKGMIILTIFFLIILAGVLEYTDFLSGVVDEISITAILLYYIYLITVYQEELRTTLAERELQIVEARLAILQGQIRPHFIFNSLGIIRSLMKRDPKKAVLCIDSFSDYLRAHIYAMQNNTPVPFESELEHVRSILALVHSDYTKQVTITYDLKETSFRLPALTLEPLVENAIKYGLDKNGGEIHISSEKVQKEDGTAEIVIRVTDSGRGHDDITEIEHRRLGVGLENTRTRLQMQCNATLSVETGEGGATAEIRMPYAGEVILDTETTPEMIPGNAVRK